MRYVEPTIETRSVTIEDAVHTVSYYEAPTLLTGVVDEAYDEYDAATVYSVGTYVKIEALKKKFRCTADGTTAKHPLAYPSAWTDYGPLNSFCMLSTDEFIDNRTQGSDMVIEIDFSRKDTVSFLDADFLSVQIELIDNSTGEVLSVSSYKGRDFGAGTYAEYYFTEYKTLSRLVIDGLEWLPHSTLRLSFSGAVSIGKLVSGNSDDLGVTMYGSSLDFEDTSKVILSEITGTRSVLRYGSMRVIEVSLRIDAADYNVLANKVEGLIGRNILFIPTTLDRFAEMITLGYFETFSLPLDNPAKIKTSATIIGV